MQTELSGGEQLALSSIFCIQPVPTAATQRTKEERYNEMQEETVADIEEAQDRIKDLKDELQEAREDMDRCEVDEYDLEPEPGDECLFDCSLPRMEEEYNELEFESETEIRLLELKIGELKATLKGGK